MIRLEPMADATFTAWELASIRDYAAEKVEAGAWPESEALGRSRREFVEQLADGPATPGHEVRSVVTDAGERVWRQ